jgi:hypothetical protein
MTTNTPNRRLAIAITAAVASVTLAIGVTAASLLGWFAPAQSALAPATAPVVYVPITPAAPRAPASPPTAIPTSPSDDVTLAMGASDQPTYADDDDEHEHRRRREHERYREEDEEDDDE